MVSRSLLFLVLVAVNVLSKVQIIQDFTPRDDGSPSWQYLGHFCFWIHGGTFEIEFKDNEEWQKDQTFCFYSDYTAQWGITYEHRDVLTCKQKEANAARCVNVTDIDRYFDGHYELAVKSIVPRWWFATISNCYADPAKLSGGGGGGDEVSGGGDTGSTPTGTALVSAPVGFFETTITFLNPDDGYGKWKVQWSKDEQSIPQQCIGFLCANAVIFGLIVYSKGVAKRTGRSYAVLKLMGLSLGCVVGNLFCKMIHCSIYDDDGIGAPGLWTLSFLLEGVAQALFVGILIDISRGYTISTNHIASRKYTYFALFLYMLLHVLVLVWDQYVADPADILYIYESPPGVVIMVLRVLMLLYMLKNYNETYGYENKATRRSFYQFMAITTSLVMLAPPITTLAATEMKSWDRARTIFAVTNGTDTITYLLMFLIFRPWDGNRFIKVLSPEDSKAFGTNNMQVFPEAKNFDEF